jgi:hypothetical protein
MSAASVNNGPETVSAACLHSGLGALTLARRRVRAASTNCVAPLCVMLGPIPGDGARWGNVTDRPLELVGCGKRGDRMKMPPGW